MDSVAATVKEPCWSLKASVLAAQSDSFRRHWAGRSMTAITNALINGLLLFLCKIILNVKKVPTLINLTLTLLTEILLFFQHDIDFISHAKHAVWNIFPCGTVTGTFQLLRAWNTVTCSNIQPPQKPRVCSLRLLLLSLSFAAVPSGDGGDDTDRHHPFWDLLPVARAGSRQGEGPAPLQRRYGHPQPAPEACVLLLRLPNVPRARRRLQRQLWWVKWQEGCVLCHPARRD